MDVATSGSGRSLTILVHEWVTGGGWAGRAVPPSWAAEGGGMRRAIAADFASVSRDGVRVIMTLDARLPRDPGPWALQRIDPGQDPNRLCDLARAADWTVLVAPETSRTLFHRTGDLQRAGARVLGSSPAAIDLTGDKAQLAQWLQARGIDTPSSRKIRPAEGLPADTEYPAVLKPVDGAGSVDTFYLSGERSLPADARALSTALLQPFVPGWPMSASYLVDGLGKAWPLGLGIQRIARDGGRFAYQGGTLPASCPGAEAPLRRAVESIPGLRGFVGVDFIWDAQRRHVTVLEINPRATTSYVGLAQLLGPGRLAEAWLQVFEHESGEGASLDRLSALVQGGRRLSFDTKGHWVPDYPGKEEDHLPARSAGA